MKLSSKIGIFGIACMTIYACRPNNDYPDIPAIEFKSFVTDGDIGTVTISFTDGDGDIGFKEGDTLPPFNYLSYYHNDLFIAYEEKVNGQWQAGLGSSGDPIEYRFRVPYVTPSGQNKALKGEIAVTIQPTYFNPGSADSDTIRFKIKLYDRSLNESNIITTEEFTR